MDPLHLDELRAARKLLEHPSVASRMSNLVGAPLEKSMALLPERARAAVQQAAHRAIESALDFSIESLASKPELAPANRLHKGLVALSGGVGGLFGLPALLVELPVSTTLMLRSIADIARSEGEDLGAIDARLACVQVFALGGSSKSDDAAETGYFALRAAMARAMSEAARHIAEKGLTSHGAPAMVRFITTVAGRFGIVVSEKAAAGAVPAIGALGGAFVNTVFIDHFQAMARGHFVVRRLERLYGAETVRAAYERLER